MPEQTIKVPVGLRFRTRLMTALKPLYVSLGNLESRILRDELDDVSVEQPIYVCSLARSGTTIVSEVLSQHNACCFHRYADFPNLFTPYWKRWLQSRNPVQTANTVERSHGDRVMVNQHSIEAFEEVLWSHFYPHIHQQGLCHIPDLKAGDPFIEFYKSHIRKLLLITGKQRYLSKANYNLNRLSAILDLFPDARFVIPIRHPINHIASLHKQHQKFLRAGQADKQVDPQLAASGHHEFGNLREVISFGDDGADQTLLKNFEGILGWARYWTHVYQNVLSQWQQSKSLQSAAFLFRYEDLCQNTETTLDEIFSHCRLKHSNYEEIKSQYRHKLASPDYYDLGFTEQQKADIMAVTEPVASQFNYTVNNHV